MKFKVSVAGHTVLLNSEQLENVLEVLAECEFIEEHYVGSGKGDNGGSYKFLLRKFDVSKVGIASMLRDQVEAMRLVTKLWDEERSAGN